MPLLQLRHGSEWRVNEYMKLDNTIDTTDNKLPSVTLVKAGVHVDLSVTQVSRN